MFWIFKSKKISFLFLLAFLFLFSWIPRPVYALCYNSTNNTFTHDLLNKDANVAPYQFMGGKFVVNNNALLISAFKNSTDTSTYGLLYDNSHSLLANVSFVGDEVTFNYVLTSGNNYFIVSDNPIPSFWNGDLSATLPQSSTDINMTNGSMYYGGSWTEFPSYYFTFKEIRTQTEISCPANPTSTRLFLNGIENNITIDTSTLLNATGLVNISLPISLYLNGTLQGTGTGKVSIFGYYSWGLYNWTAEWIGNSSYAESNATWFVLVNNATTSPNSYDLCISNTTLLLNHTENINGNATNTLIYKTCNYGCDFTSNSCMISPFEATIEGIGLFLSLMAIGSILYYKLKPRFLALINLFITILIQIFLIFFLPQSFEFLGFIFIISILIYSFLFFFKLTE